ncbi:MAG: hypothetical protein K0S44_1874 [Bacteroidetes bacterium]|jgi:hypothetical protein|nr:hypothetical protein [Bacteroidota bacterium]
MLPRISIPGVSNECLIGYHTQEFRVSGLLDSPAKCTSDKAWLGDGYYFWLDEVFAMHWGPDFKTSTGSFDVYKAFIEEDNILNMTFCEEDYFFVKNNIEALIVEMKERHMNINLKQLHRMLKTKFWLPMNIKGIMYDDLPYNVYKKGRTYSLFDPFYYVKRIQIVVFDLKLIHNFEIYKEEQTC